MTQLKNTSQQKMTSKMVSNNASSQISGSISGLADGLSVTLESKVGDKAVASWQGRHLGHFKLLSVLGRGGMGVVIRAEDRGLNRHVALKVLPQNSGQATYRVEQFIREARSAAKLEHPNIVTIYEVGDAAGYYYIAMELVEGGNLFELVKANGPLDAAAACQIIAEAAEALDYAHRMGVLHRDIKPANLMLSRAGRCKVTDFGLAKVDDPEDLFELPTNIVGTPTYISPEVADGKLATPVSDIYCLAATLWYLLVGLPPYDGKTPQEIMWKHQNAPLPKLKKFRPELPKTLIHAISRALSKKPEERFQTAEEFAKVLRAHSIRTGNVSAEPGKLIFTSAAKKSKIKWKLNKWTLRSVVAAAVFGLFMLIRPQLLLLGKSDGGTTEDLVRATDLPTLTEMANRDVKNTIDVQGRVESLELTRKGAYWAIRFEGADSHSGFRAVFPKTMAAEMEKRFGGTYGAGVIGKRVIVQGSLTQPADEPVEILLNRSQQVTVVGD